MFIDFLCPSVLYTSKTVVPNEVSLIHNFPISVLDYEINSRNFNFVSKKINDICKTRHYLITNNKSKNNQLK